MAAIYERFVFDLFRVELVGLKIENVVDAVDQQIAGKQKIDREQSGSPVQKVVSRGRTGDQPDDIRAENIEPKPRPADL